MENINDIASTTNYNGKLLLNGDYERYRKQVIAEYNGEEVTPPEQQEQIEVIEPNDPPTQIDSGPYTIRTAGVYVLGPNFTGTITIENDLVGVKIQQANSAPLQNVFINGPSNGNANLWIEGLNIKNTVDGSWIKFSGSDNVLSIKGSNTFTSNKQDNGSDLQRDKATIHIGGGLTIQGTGSLEVIERWADGAIIGTDESENSSANLTINSGNFILTAADSRTATHSPGGGMAGLIGSGGSGSMGDIVINGGNFDIYDPGGGPCIGAGANGGRTGNITIKNASIKGTTDGGACIGSGHSNSKVGDILIENANIDVESKKLFVDAGDFGYTNQGDGAGIGSGGYNSDAGNITVRNSNVNARSVWGAGIGSGYSSHAGNITIENLNGSIFSREGEDVGKGKDGTIGDVDDDGSGREATYTEYMILGTPLVIHNGTKSNQALRCFIPNMHTKNMGLENISITTQQSAQQLLGNPHNPDVPGILDKAIDYALDAATGMGSYIIELNASEDNLVTSSENTQASESTIRDADMARTALEYAKYNVLSQASQSMLAQANQTSSQVLSLLGM